MTAAHRYQIIAPLARGGMGEILLARRLGPAGFEKLVVLKRPLHTAGSRALVTALIDEARLLAQIHHPNVCEIYDLEQAGDQFFFTMEYLEGLSMWSVLGEVPGGIDPRILCGLFEQACDGLEAIHVMRTADGGRIVHRDVSPGNLFVTERGVVKVLDLGIAKSTGAEERTPFGRVKGKLGYLSPEQAAGQPIDHRSDLFSLGLVLHDLVSGRRPKPDRIGAIVATTLDLAAVPLPLAEVIQCATAADRHRRFRSAAEMAVALRDAGAALGGSSGSREIAAWLADQFGPELARRRAIAAGPADSTQTQIWILRSASADADDDDDGAAPHDTAEQSEHAAVPSHETERLAVPARERLAPPTGDPKLPATDKQVRPPTGEPLTAAGERMRPPTGIAVSGAGRRGAAIAGLGAAIAIVIGVSVALVVPDGAAGAAGGVPTARAPASAPTATAAAPAPGAPATSPAAPAPIVPSLAANGAAANAAAANAPSMTETAAATDDHATDDRATPPAAPPARPRKPRRPPEAAAGLLTIDSQPFAVIRLGNRNLGTTPLWRIPLPAGRHEFRATTADGRYQDIEFRIAPGHERKVILDWRGP